MLKKIMYTISTLFIAANVSASQDHSEYVSASGTSGEYYVSAAAQNYMDTSFYTRVYVRGPGTYINCTGYPVTDPLDVNGSAKKGSASFSTADMTCFGATNTKAVITLTCAADGVSSYQSIGNYKQTYANTSYSGHGQTTQNSAQCSVDVNGAIYNVGGSITERHEVTKTK